MNNEILIIGAGNQALALAYDLARSGVVVNIWNRTLEHVRLLQQTKTIYLKGNPVGVRINKVSTDIREVFCECIVVAIPSIGHADIANLLAPFLTQSTVVLLSPGRTFGAVCFVEYLKLAEASIPHVFELQTIIHTARKCSEDTIQIFARKKEVFVSSYISDDYDIMRRLPEVILNKLKYVESMVYTSLGNMGMLLHCAPTLMNIGCIESDRVSFKYYFDGISPVIAHYIENMDKERLLIAKCLGYDLETLLDWFNRTYQVKESNLYTCLQKNICYREIDAPNTIRHRYIYEDIPCGLVPLESLAYLLHLKVPYISLIIDMANKLLQYDFREKGRKVFSLNMLDGKIR